MGSSQSSKTYVKSPPMELEKLRLVNGSMKEGPRPGNPRPRAKGGVEEGGGAHAERETRKSSSKSSSGDGSRGEVLRKNDGSMKKVDEEDELLVNGWPKWLVDNIPSDVLKNIVPKSADSYTKIDKVDLSFFDFSHFWLILDFLFMMKLSLDSEGALKFSFIANSFKNCWQNWNFSRPKLVKRAIVYSKIEIIKNG